MCGAFPYQGAVLFSQRLFYFKHITMRQIYHPWHIWEDYKKGFYNITSNNNKDKLVTKVLELFNNEETTKIYMNRVINEWVYSCEHNLSNNSMNRIAWIGQAACCIYGNVPNLITMHAWNLLSIDIQERSNKIANKIINLWEQKQLLKNTLIHGNKKGTKMGYQMRLQFNYKNGV